MRDPCRETLQPLQTDRAEVTFSRADTDYAVFDSTKDGKRNAGMRVTTVEVWSMSCVASGVIHGALMSRCDNDNALNGEQCP